MDRYSLTPFDKRYLKLPYEWMEYSYLRFMSKNGFEEIRDYHLKTMFEAEKNKKYDEELKEQMEQYGDGFSPAMMEDVMKAFKDAK